MGLVISLQKEEFNGLMIKASLAITMESYLDLQNSYGFALRNLQLININSLLALITKIDKTNIGESLTFDLSDTILLLTSFDITLKLLRSSDPFRFLHAFENNKPKRQQFKLDLIQFCKEMTEELPEQAIFRSEIEQHLLVLAEINYH